MSPRLYQPWYCILCRLIGSLSCPLRGKVSLSLANARTTICVEWCSLGFVFMYLLKHEGHHLSHWLQRIKCWNGLWKSIWIYTRVARLYNSAIITNVGPGHTWRPACLQWYLYILEWWRLSCIICTQTLFSQLAIRAVQFTFSFQCLIWTQ